MTNKNTGILYGVSLGPGDPGLITRQAWDILQQDNIFWTYPVKNKKSDRYALDIVLRSGLVLPENNSAALTFPMTHDKEKLAKHWLIAAQTVLDILLTGQDVAFLVEGDASTYATFGHLTRTINALNENIESKVIAGVSSFNAAAAQMQIPLAEVDDTMAVIPAGYGLDVISHMLDEFDTLILLKVKPLIDGIIDLLTERELIAHSHFIEKAGTPDEWTVDDVASLRGQKVGYLSLMIIKNPQRQRRKMIPGCSKKMTKSSAEKTPA